MPRRTRIDGKSLILLVGAGRFELPTPSPPDWCANQAAPRSGSLQIRHLGEFISVHRVDLVLIWYSKLATQRALYSADGVEAIVIPGPPSLSIGPLQVRSSAKRPGCKSPWCPGCPLLGRCT